MPSPSPISPPVRRFRPSAEYVRDVLRGIELAGYMPAGLDVSEFGCLSFKIVKRDGESGYAAEEWTDNAA